MSEILRLFYSVLPPNLTLSEAPKYATMTYDGITRHKIHCKLSKARTTLHEIISVGNGWASYVKEHFGYDIVRCYYADLEYVVEGNKQHFSFEIWIEVR